MNREKAIRTAYFQALNGNLSYNSVNIPVYDGVISATASDQLFVTLDTQTATDNLSGGFQMLNWDTTIDIMIISKQSYSVSKDIVDDVSEQIEDLILLDAVNNGLVPQSGWQINNVRLKSARIMKVTISNVGTYMPKILTFSQRIIKQ